MILRLHLRCCGAEVMGGMLSFGFDAEDRVSMEWTPAYSGATYTGCCPACWHARPIGAMR